MIIKFSGECTQLQLNQHINTIVTDVVMRAGLELSAVKIKDAQVGVVMFIGGEPKYLQVEPAGVPEIFQVYVKLDENGEIEGAPVDNQDKTFLDDYTLAISKGETYNFNDPIESEYDAENLELVNTVDGGDLVETYYNIKEGPYAGDLVVQYRRNHVLVAEFRLVKKDKEDTEEEVTEPTVEDETATE